jgi:hypothetical protein
VFRANSVIIVTIRLSVSRNEFHIY